MQFTNECMHNKTIILTCVAHHRLFSVAHLSCYNWPLPPVPNDPPFYSSPPHNINVN